MELTIGRNAVEIAVEHGGFYLHLGPFLAHIAREPRSPGEERMWAEKLPPSAAHGRLLALRWVVEWNGKASQRERKAAYMVHTTPLPELD
jgi:hypothetical protein